MAVPGNAYPAVQLDARGEVVDSGVVVQFTDSTDQPGSGGGGSQPAVIVQLATAGTLPALSSCVIPNTLVGGASFGGVGADGTIAGIPTVIGAMSNVVAGTDVTLQTSGEVPSTPDALDLELNVFVTDQLGTNTAMITANVSVAQPVTDTFKTLDLSGGTWNITAGTDLTDAGGGTLTSTAGGVYSAYVTALASWD